MKFLFSCFTPFCLTVVMSWGPWARAASPGSVSGLVTDPREEAAADISMTLRPRNGNRSFSTFTGSRGVYRFANVAPGHYLLEAADGSSTFGASELLTLRPGEEVTRDIRLRVRGTPTEVQVTASGTPRVLYEVAKAAEAVDGAEISRRGEYAIAEAIRNLPGVRVKQSGGPGALMSIQTRGLRNHDTALLIDGLRFRDAAGLEGDATAFYENLLVVDTERVEFLRGSGSSIYGSHAMGGAINVSSRTGGGPTHGEISAEGGGLGFYRGLARIGGGLGGVDRFVYSAGISHVNVIDGVDGADAYRNSSGQGSARYYFRPSISLSGRVWASDAFSALNESPTFDPLVLENHPGSGPVRAVGLAPDQLARFAGEQPFDAGGATFIQGFNDPDSRRVSSFFAGALVLQHELSARNSYRISYHGVDTNRAFRDGPAGRSAFDPAFSSDGRFDGRIDTVTARTDHHLGTQLFSFGYEFEREEYFNFNTDENPDPALRDESSGTTEQRSHAVFAQDQMRLADGRLQIGLSGRLQGFTLESPGFSGNANPYLGVESVSPRTAYTADGAIAYFFRSSNTKLRAHVGNSYRAPSSFERFGASFFGGFASFWGDPRLAPERSIAVDGGIDQWVFGSKLRLSGTYFYTALQEVIVFDFGIIDPLVDPFGRFGGYRNAGGGLARGAEFSVSAAPNSSLNLTASYTYTNSVLRSPTVPGESFFKRLGVSDHMFSLTATQRFGRRFDVTFDLFAAGDYPLTFFGADRRLMFDGPVKADLVATYAIPVGEGKELRVFGKTENLFDHRYFENGFETPGAWAVGGLKFSF